MQVSAPAETDPIQLFFHDDTTLPGVEKLKKLLIRLEKVRSNQSSDFSFVRSVFFKTHKRLLHDYDPSASVPETLESGRFGCLSGTALYAVILKHFGIDYEIIETTAHVYLKVNANDKTVLFESTLPIEGFISDVKEITSATQQYQADSRKNTSLISISGIGEQTEGADTFTKSISLVELSGLQYYNMAIYNLEDQDYKAALLNAERSVLLYPSKRTEKLMEMVIKKIWQSKSLTKDLKSVILNNYIAEIKKKKLTQRT